MSFDVKNNWFIKAALITVSFGILLGTGSLYRYLYSYNLIMFATMAMMIAIIAYQYFLPSYNNIDTDNNFVTRGMNSSGLLLILFMISLTILSDILNQVESYEIVLFYTVFLLITVLLDSEFRNKIYNYYLIIIVILSIISLVFILLSIFTNLLEVLPHFRQDKMFITDFYYVWSIPPNTLFSRNQSIFWEPGAFGYHIMLATLLAYKNKNKLFIMILILTGITTFSTSVYFFLFFILLYHLTCNKNKLKTSIIIITSMIMAYFIINSILEDTLFFRLATSAIFDKFSPSSNTYISFAGRSLYSLEAFNLFLDHFLLGAGHYSTAVELEVVQSGVAVNSSGFFGLLAEFGSYGIFCIYLYIRFFKYFKIFAIPIAIIWLNGEFLQYSPMSLFILADMSDHLAKKLFP